MKFMDKKKGTPYFADHSSEPEFINVLRRLKRYLSAKRYLFQRSGSTAGLPTVFL